MARRKKDSGARYLLFLVVVFLLVVLTFAIAAAIVCLWAYREFTTRRRVAELKDQLDHSDSELNAMRALDDRHQRLVMERQAIDEEGSHLSRRKDGYFQERSTLAKALNARLAPVVEQGRATEAELQQYREAPEARRAACIELAATLQSTRVAVACLALVGAAIAFLDPAWAASLGTWIITHGLWVPDMDPTLYTAVILSTWTAVGLYFLVREFARGAIAETLSADAGRATETEPNPTAS